MMGVGRGRLLEGHCGLNEGIRRCDRVDGISAYVDVFALVAVLLLDVEDTGGFDHEVTVEVGLAVFSCVVIIAGELLVEDDERGGLALADLRATVGSLSLLPNVVLQGILAWEERK